MAIPWEGFNRNTDRKKSSSLRKKTTRERNGMRPSFMVALRDISQASGWAIGSIDMCMYVLNVFLVN